MLSNAVAWQLYCLIDCLPLLQGMEKDIILLATTISHAGAFATDVQRVNVALTRAKHHLVVLGCSHVLCTSSAAFRMLLSNCQMLPAGAHLLPPSTQTSMVSMRNEASACVGDKQGLGRAEYHQDGSLPTGRHLQLIAKHSCKDLAEDKQYCQVTPVTPAAEGIDASPGVACEGSNGVTPQYKTKLQTRSVQAPDVRHTTDSICTADDSPHLVCSQAAEQNSPCVESSLNGCTVPNLVFDVHDN